MKKARKKHKYYSFAEKKLVLEQRLSDQYVDLPLKQFSEICRVNYWTMKEWGNKIDWDKSRIDELRKKPRARKVDPTELGLLQEPVQQLILNVKGLFPTWGPLKIKQYLFRHEQILLSQSAIYRFLKKQGLVHERPAPTPGHTRSFEYPYPLAAVQMDLMDLKLSNGAVIYLVSLLDDFSRFVLGNHFIAVKTMDEVIDVFSEAVRSYGVMERVLTDLGSEFVSWQRFTKFEELLCSLDIEHIASGPDKKENQGKVERWHRTVREALRERGPLDFSSEAQFWIRHLTDVYNYERPHQALGGLTPSDRFFGVSDELDAELAEYRAGNRAGQRLYFACRAGDQRIVVSGPRADKLSVLLNGLRLEETAVQSEADGGGVSPSVATTENAKGDGDNLFQLEKKTKEAALGEGVSVKAKGTKDDA